MARYVAATPYREACSAERAATARARRRAAGSEAPSRTRLLSRVGRPAKSCATPDGCAAERSTTASPSMPTSARLEPPTSSTSDARQRPVAASTCSAGVGGVTSRGRPSVGATGGSVAGPVGATGPEASAALAVVDRRAFTPAR